MSIRIDVPDRSLLNGFVLVSTERPAFGLSNLKLIQSVGAGVDHLLVGPYVLSGENRAHS